MSEEQRYTSTEADPEDTYVRYEDYAALRQHAQDDRDTIQGLEQDVTLISEQLATAEERTEMALTQLAGLQKANNPYCLHCGKTEPCMTKADLKPEDPGIPCTFDYTPLQMLHVARQYKQQLAEVTKARDNWHAIVTDHCDEDEEFRKEAGALDTSDSYGVESHTDILKRVKQQLEQRTQERDRLANPIEHADYFAPQIITLQQQLAVAREYLAKTHGIEENLQSSIEENERLTEQLAEAQARVQVLEGALTQIQVDCTELSLDDGCELANDDKRSTGDRAVWQAMAEMAQRALTPPPKDQP